MPSKTIDAKREAAGISDKTLWRAKDTLGVKASKERGSMGGEWWWRDYHQTHYDLDDYL